MSTPIESQFDPLGPFNTPRGRLDSVARLAPSPGFDALMLEYGDMLEPGA